MLQVNSQNDILVPDTFQSWFRWLSQNSSFVQYADGNADQKTRLDTDIPDSLLNLLQCISSIPSLVGSNSIGAEKLKGCLEILQDNQDEIAVFFGLLQQKPSIMVEMMQQLGKPMLLPLKDLVKAMEDIADDSTQSSNKLRDEIIAYLELVKHQQLGFVSLMQTTAEALVKRKKSQGAEQNVGDSLDEWVLEFETRFVNIAKQDEYAKDLGMLINASVRVLKAHKEYRDQLGGSPAVI